MISLKVGNNIYTDANVADGFYVSISNLKTLHQITYLLLKTTSKLLRSAKSEETIPRITPATPEKNLTQCC